MAVEASMSARREEPASTSAKILYRPFGLVSSMAAGMIASLIFKKVWARAAPGEHSDPPKPLESEYPLRELLLAAAIQGLIYSVIKASVDRGGARAFQKWTGEWPGN